MYWPRGKWNANEQSVSQVQSESKKVGTKRPRTRPIMKWR